MSTEKTHLPISEVHIIVADRARIQAERDRYRQALDTIKKLTYDQPNGLFAEEARTLHWIAVNALGQEEG